MLKKYISDILSLIFCLLLIVGCSKIAKESPVESPTISKSQDIVETSIEVHGGWLTYSQLKTLHFKKRIILYDSLGKMESDQTQFHKYQLKPTLAGSIKWVGMDTIEIIYEDKVAKKMIGGKRDSGSDQLAINTFLSGYYVTFQPFKLLDNPSRLQFAGIDTLQNGKEVYIVQPIDTTVGADEWWYYFDTTNDQLVANMVKHDVRFSMIENLEYDSTTGLVFNAHRKSYFVDSLQNRKYLRAEYFYTDYKAEYEK